MTSAFDGRRVLVTGATGFIGSWLSRSLVQEGARVVALVMDWDPQSLLLSSPELNSITIVNGRLEDFDVLERAMAEHEIDIVFHLAAQSLVGVALRAPLITLEANIRGTYNLLEAARRNIDRVSAVVVASSDKAYGDSEQLPYREDHPLQGRYPYDVSKSCADLIAQAYHSTYGLPVAIARCGNVYGGGDLNWSRIVPGTIRSLVRGERPIVRSDGTLTRDYLFVEDVVEAYKDLAVGVSSDPSLKGESFNFGPDRSSSVLEMVAQIGDLMDASDLTPDVQDTADAEITHQHLDSAKAETRLGWKTRYGLRDGLERTIRWYREYLAK